MPESELKEGFFRRRRRGTGKAPRIAPVSVRPGSNEERQAWIAAAQREGVSLHSLILYFIRVAYREWSAGRLQVEKVTEATVRLKMPE